MLNKRNSIIILILILAVVVAGLLVWNWKFRVQAKEFVGQVAKVEGSTIFANGAFLVPGHPELSNPNDKKDVQIMVTTKTKFIKTILYLPSVKEVESAGGYYNPEKLKKEKVSGSLDDIIDRENFGITVKPQEAVNDNKFEAREVLFVEPVFP